MTALDWYTSGFFVTLGVIGAVAVVAAVLWAVGFVLGAFGLWDGRSE